MKTKDLLLEIGVEELPAGYIHNAVTKLNTYFADIFHELQLSYRQIQVFSTPRRIGLIVNDLQAKQLDSTEEKVGPAKQAAYDLNGELTRAAQGFLKSAGASEKDIYIVQTPKGEKIALKIEVKGSETEVLLKKLIPEAIELLPFPKKMKWKNKDLTFARPVRWLLILFGNEILELEFKNIISGKYTFGNRFLSLDNKIEINNIDEYEIKLKENFVIAQRNKRQELLRKRIEDLLIDSNLKLIEDAALFEIVTDLIEHPQPVIAEFDKRYLDLPERIITSTLSQHQKYFSLADSNGELSNKFLFVSNGDPQFSELIKLGNEKVIRARLEDAEFFYKEDLKTTLEEYVPRLSEVTFQEKLGSILEKTERIKKNADFISNLLKLPDFVKAKTLRTATLCKADLVTLMMGEKEFAKLQGYIGWKYAEKSQEKTPVPKAIFEHYLPRWQNDALPESMEGSIVAIADKIDTICGIIGVGMLPTGSKDPFALRRAANGVVQIIAEKGFDLNLEDLIRETFSNLKAKLAEPENNIDFVFDFMKQRINWFLREKGIDYDVIDSVMHIDHNHITDLLKRANALQELKKSSSFIDLVTGFKRVSNIIEKFDGSISVQKELLEENSEKKLFSEYHLLKKNIDEILKNSEYGKILLLLVDFGKYINEFFDNVLVNVESEKLRNNRYGILGMIRVLFLKVADISKIVIEGN